MGVALKICVWMIIEGGWIIKIRCTRHAIDKKIKIY